MGERELIGAIERALHARGGRVLRGPGDDAAVVAAEPVAVTSVDTVVEGVHFELSTHSYADVGHKALASALSDLAAMGAQAGEAYVALVLPASTRERDALSLVTAMDALADRLGVRLAGGDVVSGPALVASVTVTGWERESTRLLYRDGASPGDLVGVSGELGGSGAGLLLLGGVGGSLPSNEREALVRRHRRPEPRLALGGAAAAAGTSAMIDVSDGVATDAGHLAERSGVEIRIRLDDLPLAAGVAAVAREAGRDAAELAATAGEDFELLLCAPPTRRGDLERAARTAGTAIVWIGEVAAGSGVVLLRGDGSAADLVGYDHLAGGERGGGQRLSADSVPPSEPGPA